MIDDWEKMGEIMNEGVKIYMRSNSKIYVCVNEEIFYYENEELASVLEMLKEEYEFEEEKMSLSIILHFSYFLLDDKKIWWKYVINSEYW